jgi:hypothetical protein
MDDTYYTTTTTTQVSPETQAAIGIVYLVLFVFFAIPSIIATWQLYKKAGKPGWPAIVPFYNTIVMSDIAKLGIGWAIAAIFVPFVGIYVLIKFVQQYDWGMGKILAYIFLPIVALFMLKNVNYKGGAPEATAYGPAPVNGYQQPQQTASPQYTQPTQPVGTPAPGQPVQDVNQPNQNTPGGYPQA